MEAKMRLFLAFLSVATFTLLAPHDAQAQCVQPSNDSLYTANANVTLCTASYSNLRVQMNSDDITLDCNGSVLDGLNRTLTAITVNSGMERTTVSNCTIRNYQRGYYLDFYDTDDNDYIINNTFYNNTYGVRNTFDNWRLQVSGNTFELNDYGVHLDPGRYHNISGNVFVDQRYSSTYFGDMGQIWYVNIEGNSFTSSTVSTYAQVDVDDSIAPFHYGNITNNVFQDVLGPAVSLIGNSGNGNNISGNRFVNVNGTAIYIYAFNASTASGNYFDGVNGYGMNFFMQANGVFNEVRNNTFVNGRGGASYAMYFFNTFLNGTIADNYVWNYTYSVYFASGDPSYNEFYNNFFNTSSNPQFSNSTNRLNATIDCSSPNIVRGSCKGGNYWGRMTHVGFSDTCTDANADGFCDANYTTNGVTDFLPLVWNMTDVSPPSIAINRPANSTNGETLFNVTFGETVNWSAFMVDSNGTNMTIGAVSSYEAALPTLSEGPHNITVFANDSSGNMNLAIRHWTRDTLAPDVIVQFPANHSNLSLSSVNVTGTASDTHADTVECDNSSFGGNIGTFSSWNFTYDSVPEGLYIVTIIANDTAGNSNSTEVRFRIDRTAPYIETGLPQTPQGNSSQDYIEINVTTADYLLSAINVTLHNPAGFVNHTSCTQSPCFANFTGLPDGDYFLNATAYDIPGNQNSTETFNMTLDTHAPAITGTANGSTTKNSAYILWNTSENSNSSVDYGQDEEDLNETSGESSQTVSHNVTLSGLHSNATYHYNVTSCDAAGNCNTSGPRNFTTMQCTPSWSCASWGACQSGGVRTCSSWSDSESCGAAYEGSSTGSCTYSSGSSHSSGSAAATVPAPAEANRTVTIEKGKTLELNLSEGFTVKIEATERMEGVMIATEELPGRPGSVKDVGKEKKVYSYVNITAAGVDEGRGNITIEFNVSRSWMTENAIDEDTISLNRFHAGDWHELQTVRIGGNGSVLYSAQTPGFSIFAITGKALEEVMEPAGGAEEPHRNSCIRGTMKCEGETLLSCEDGRSWKLKDERSRECTVNASGWEALQPEERMTLATACVAAIAVIAVLSMFWKRRKKTRKARFPSDPDYIRDKWRFGVNHHD